MMVITMHTKNTIRNLKNNSSLYNEHSPYNINFNKIQVEASNIKINYIENKNKLNHLLFIK